MVEVLIFHRKITVKTQFSPKSSRIIKNHQNFTNLTLLYFLLLFSLQCILCGFDRNNKYNNKSVSLYWYFVYYDNSKMFLGNKNIWWINLTVHFTGDRKIMDVFHMTYFTWSISIHINKTSNHMNVVGENTFSHHNIPALNLRSFKVHTEFQYFNI